MKTREDLFTRYFKKNRADDLEKILVYIQDDTDKCIFRAHHLNNLEEGIFKDPIYIRVPDNFYDNNNYKISVSKKSQTIVYDESLFTAIFVDDQKLYYYQANVDHKRGLIAYEIAGEVLLKTIIHIQTVFDYNSENNVDFLSLDLILGIMDGSKLSFRLRNQFLNETLTTEEFLSIEEKKALEKIKNAVRNVK